MLAVARLINNRRTIRAVRDLRECHENEFAIQEPEYSTGNSGHRARRWEFAFQRHFPDSFRTTN